MVTVIIFLPMYILMEKKHRPLFLLILLCCLPQSLQGWPWGASSSSSASPSGHHGRELSSAEFSPEILQDEGEGMKLLEEARNTGPDTCMGKAYRKLFSSCAEILVDQDMKQRLSWEISNCFQVESGRPPFPACGPRDSMLKCRKKLDEYEHQTYRDFFLRTDDICHRLQRDAFNHQTGRLVNDLTQSARFAEEKLEKIEERSEQLLQGSNQLQDSLASLDVQTQQAAQATRDIGSHIVDISRRSEAIFEQSKEIAASQLELREGQAGMKETLESGMARLHESYESLGDGMEKLRGDTMQIDREIKQVGESMSSKMQDLHIKANDIGNVAGDSLERQKMLLDQQGTALEGLDFLKKSQSQALEESRDALQNLAELGRKQQEELRRRQEIFQQAQDRMIKNSQSILTAQEEFESKQANIFAALDKLFLLHNAILVESRFIKTFFFYSAVIFLLYMLTSAKQTFGIRARLYLGFCITFVAELGIIRVGSDDFDHQTWITSNIFLVRTLFLTIAAIQIVYSIFTYRDYERLNHQLLQSLVEKVRTMEQNTGKFLSSNQETDMSISQYSWIDEELSEEVCSNIDPDYVSPEDVEETSITTSSVTRRYHLRPRVR